MAQYYQLFLCLFVLKIKKKFPKNIRILLVYTYSSCAEKMAI